MPGKDTQSNGGTDQPRRRGCNLEGTPAQTQLPGESDLKLPAWWGWMLVAGALLVAFLLEALLRHFVGFE